MCSFLGIQRRTAPSINLLAYSWIPSNYSNLPVLYNYIIIYYYILGCVCISLTLARHKMDLKIEQIMSLAKVGV